jgi:hypothetical protein
MRVNRFNLSLLMSGFVDMPTRGERMVAVIRLTGRANTAGTGILTTGEIADRLGTTLANVQYQRERVRMLRSERTRRRLADVQWRAMEAIRRG